MNLFLQPFDKLGDFEALKDRLNKKNRNYYELSGVTASGKAHVTYALSKFRQHSLVITENELKARELYDELSFFP